MLEYTTKDPLENAPSQLFFTEATVCTQGVGFCCLEKNWAVEEGHRGERGVILLGRSCYKKISKSEVEGQEKNIKKLNL